MRPNIFSRRLIRKLRTSTHFQNQSRNKMKLDRDEALGRVTVPYKNIPTTLSGESMLVAKGEEEELLETKTLFAIRVVVNLIM